MSAQISLEEFIDRLAEILKSEQDFHWAVGELLACYPDTKEINNAIASGVGRSAAWVKEHRATYLAFAADDATRALDMAWQIHVMAARTSDPIAWLEYAVKNQCSTRELRERLVEEGEITERAKEPKSCPHCGGAL